jgi:hypothetical protein
MAPNAQTVSSFLEVHYYSGGLRHQHFATGGVRPEWAPPPDDVGFRDEFSLSDGDKVVEFHRRYHQGNRLTWVAVYAPSVDEKLGRRANHLGVGVWLREMNITDTREMLGGLKLLLESVGQVFSPEQFRPNAMNFLSVYLPGYLKPIDLFRPLLSGVEFALNSIAQTKHYEVVFEAGRDPMKTVADEVLHLSFWAPAATPPRSLFHVQGVQARRARDLNPQALNRDADRLSDFISALPQALGESAIELKFLKGNAEDLSRMNRALREQNGSLIAQIELISKERDSIGTQLATLEKENPAITMSRRLNDIGTSLADMSSGLKLLDRRVEQLSFAADRPRPPVQPVEPGLKAVSAETWWDVLYICVLIACGVFAVVGVISLVLTRDLFNVF